MITKWFLTFSMSIFQYCSLSDSKFISSYVRYSKIHHTYTCTVVDFWMKFCWWPLTTKYFKIFTGGRLKWTYIEALMKVFILSLNFIDNESPMFKVLFLKLPLASLFWFRYFVNKQILLYLELAVTNTLKK